MNESSSARSQSTGRSLFPLPYLQLPLQPRTSSHRSWSRHYDSRDLVYVTNSAVRSLNSLAHDGHSVQGDFVSAAQQRLSDFVFSSSRAFLALGRRQSGFTLRQLGNICEAMALSLPSLSSFDSFSTDLGYMSTPSAVPIIANKMSLPDPDSLPCLSLLSLLPSSLSAVYEAPSSALLVDSSCRPSFKPASVFGSITEYHKLIVRLHGLNMVGFTLDPKAVNGVFGVPKGDMQRLIIDAHNGNACFVPSPPVRLPSPDVLASLCQSSSTPLYAAKVDLSNFYHQLRLPSWMCPYFCLPPVSPRDVGLVSGPLANEPLVYPMCLTLPMGFSHSVFLAQSVNENILYSTNSLDAKDNILHNHGCLVDRCLHGIYIDDGFLLGPEESAVLAAYKRMLAGYSHIGVLVNWKKSQAPTASGIELIGLELSGCTLRPITRKLWSLMAATLAVLTKSRVSGKRLSSLVGSWSWFCLLRRPSLSAFQQVYRFAALADKRAFPLWPSVRKELWTVLGLAPLLFTDMSLSVFRRVAATDASMAGGAVVASRTDPELSRLVMSGVCTPPSTSASQTSASTLAQPSMAQATQHADTEVTTLSTVVERMSWRKILSKQWFTYGTHINALELRSVFDAVRWCLSYPSSISTRFFVLTDSAVCFYVLSKGRSSSFQLLCLSRRISALLLASGISLSPAWLPSASNPADYFSRYEF